MKSLVVVCMWLSAGMAFGKGPEGYYSLPHEYTGGPGPIRHTYRLFEHDLGKIRLHFRFERAHSLYASDFHVLTTALGGRVLYVIDPTTHLPLRVDPQGETLVRVPGPAVAMARFSPDEVAVLLENNDVMLVDVDGKWKPLLPVAWRRTTHAGKGLARVSEDRIAILNEGELLSVDVRDRAQPDVRSRVDLTALRTAHPYLETLRGMVANAQGAWIDCGVNALSAQPQYQFAFVFLNYDGQVSLPHLLSASVAGHRLLAVEASSRLLFRDTFDYMALLPGGKPQMLGAAAFNETAVRKAEPSYRFSWHGTPVSHTITDRPWEPAGPGVGRLMHAIADGYLLDFGVAWADCQRAGMASRLLPFDERMAPDSALLFNQSNRVLEIFGRLTRDELAGQGLRFRSFYLEVVPDTTVKQMNFRAVAQALAARDLQVAGTCLTSFNGGSADVPILVQ